MSIWKRIREAVLGEKAPASVSGFDMYAAAVENNDTKIYDIISTTEDVFDRMKFITFAKDLSSRNFRAAGRALMGMLEELDGWTHTPIDNVVISNGAPARDTASTVQKVGAGYTLVGCRGDDFLIREVHRMQELFPGAKIATPIMPPDDILLMLELLRRKRHAPVDVLLGPFSGPPWAPFPGPSCDMDLQNLCEDNDQTVAVGWSGPMPSDRLLALRQWADAAGAPCFHVLDLYDSMILNADRDALEAVKDSADPEEIRAVVGDVNRGFLEYAHLEDKGTTFSGNPETLIDRASALVDIAIGDLGDAAKMLVNTPDATPHTALATVLCYAMERSEELPQALPLLAVQHPPMIPYLDALMSG